MLANCCSLAGVGGGVAAAVVVVVNVEVRQSQQDCKQAMSLRSPDRPTRPPHPASPVSPLILGGRRTGTDGAEEGRTGAGEHFGDVRRSGVVDDSESKMCVDEQE